MFPQNGTDKRERKVSWWRLRHELNINLFANNRRTVGTEIMKYSSASSLHTNTIIKRYHVLVQGHVDMIWYATLSRLLFNCVKEIVWLNISQSAMLLGSQDEILIYLDKFIRSSLRLLFWNSVISLMVPVWVTIYSFICLTLQMWPLAVALWLLTTLNGFDWLSNGSC